MTMIYRDNEPRVKRQKYDFAMESTHNLSLICLVYEVEAQQHSQDEEHRPRHRVTTQPAEVFAQPEQGV
jgi:hypothetical protein